MLRGSQGTLRFSGVDGVLENGPTWWVLIPLSQEASYTQGCAKTSSPSVQFEGKRLLPPQGVVSLAAQLSSVLSSA